MPMLRECQTAVVARNDTWEGPFTTEPYECGWARELIIFVRFVALTGDVAGAVARVQISPDGIHWCDEDTVVVLPDAVGDVRFARIIHFGQYVRLVGDLPAGASARVLVTINAKA